MITSLFLPETLGMPMSQTMKEAEENYYKSPRDILKKSQEKTNLDTSTSDEEKGLLKSSIPLLRVCEPVYFSKKLTEEPTLHMTPIVLITKQFTRCRDREFFEI